MAFARTPEAHRALSMAFEHRAVEKTYVAAVRGAPLLRRGSIATALHQARKGKMRPALAGEPGALEARTEYEVTRVWRLEADLVAAVTARPFTGRHHQIRVHLKSIGTPILRDALYGGREPEAIADLPMSRLALHARRLSLPHPSSGRQVVVDAQEPDDLRALRAHLDAHGFVAATAGDRVYVSNGSEDVTYGARVNADGSLADLQPFADRGGECVAVDGKGNVYVANGQIFVYDKAGKQIDRIDVPERPLDMVFGGAGGKTLFILAHHTLYALQTGS